MNIVYSKGPPNCCTKAQKMKQKTEGRARASTTLLADLVRMGFCLQTKHSSGG
jgi:hypothetical protein